MAAAEFWGTLAIPLFGDPATWGTGLGRWDQFLVQAAGVGACFLWAFGLGFTLLWLINRLRPLRIDPEGERIGLNVVEHGASTEILDLLGEMDRQRQSGDFSHHVSVEPHTEVGRIAGQYNRVLDAINAETSRREAALLALEHMNAMLDTNARALKARSVFEHLIADISTQLIDTPLKRTGQGILEGLERLGRHTGVDRVYVALQGAADPTNTGTHIWCREGIVAADDWPEGALKIGSKSNCQVHERHGCFDVPSVYALPPSEAKSLLRARGIRSWLCVPLWHEGNCVGLLGFDAVEREKHWADDDIVLLRTIGEIFANTLRREQAERERRALEMRSRHAQRMEALGTLAGGIAHDFNNISAPFSVTPKWCSADCVGTAANGMMWRRCERPASAPGRSPILAFSRRTEQRHRPVRMHALLEETAGLLRASLSPTIDLRLHLPDEDAIVLGDASRLQQVVMNLCNNGAHAMAGQGVIDVTLTRVAVDAERGLSHATLAAGRYVRLTVHDSGHGMDAATLERIFEPFFTTKSVGTGTGLGLAMVHGIVADHGGAINVRSKPGASSSFEAYFPEAEALLVDDHVNDAPMPRGRGETILIIDDEKPLVQLSEEMVAALGYEPIGFASSTSAMAAIRADPTRFDLVLVDEAMPGMTGSELAAALHAIRPDLPVILMTGYTG